MSIKELYFFRKDHLSYNSTTKNGVKRPYSKKLQTEKIQEIKTMILLCHIFLGLLSIDFIVCLINEAYLLMNSSAILIIALIIARILIAKDRSQTATILVSYSFYVVAIYHAYFIKDIIISYLALVITPVLSAVLMRHKPTKMGLLFLSIICYFLCNNLAGLNYFDNYLFFVALLPSFIGMLYFHDRLQLLEREKLRFIKELEEKNQEIILFSQMMGHDLKAPLNSIKGYSTLLQKRIKKDDKMQMEFLHFIIDGTKSMKNLIDNLLTYSKASTDLYTFKLINLADLIQEQKMTFHFQIAEQKIIFNEKNLTNIIGNKSALQTVFQNLISNSIKYQPIDKENHIPEISIELVKTEKTNQIYFRDNGIGIKKENIPSLFQPFRRFHSAFEYEGTGLGMSICEKILNKHNGKISVFESDENGTCFLIEIPTDLE